MKKRNQVIRGQGRPAKYPWKTWLNGEPHRLVWGSDFHVHPVSLRKAAYTAATRRGMKVSVSIYEEKVVVIQCLGLKKN